MKTVKRKKSWPKWARYKATDDNGAVWIYEREPRKSSLGWACFEYFEIHACMVVRVKKNYKGNWNKTLRKIEG